MEERDELRDRAQNFGEQLPFPADDLQLDDGQANDDQPHQDRKAEDDEKDADGKPVRTGPGLP